MLFSISQLHIVFWLISGHSGKGGGGRRGKVDGGKRGRMVGGANLMLKLILE